jgi:NADH-quinone oxidoreductase subunit H
MESGMGFILDPIGVISQWLMNLLTGIGLSAGLSEFILMAIGVFSVAMFGLLLTIPLIWLERRVGGAMQDRIGPNRVGPEGILQPFADALKLIIKEDIVPAGADKVVFGVAPVIAVLSVLAIWAVVPFAHNIMGADLNVGVFYIAAVGGLGTLAIMLAGWSSNNKYALVGAFRTVAQLVSYEVPMILSMLAPVLLARSMGLNDIVKSQEVWFVFLAPIPALIFLISSAAEAGRAPFDLLEAESEIVAGYNIEYGGMKFGMFFVAEFLHAFTVGALVAVLFLGGWRGPGAEQYPLLGVVYFLSKSFLGYMVLVTMRFSLPRIRIDGLLNFNWKFLVPLSLAAVLLTMLVDKAIPASIGGWGRAGLFFLMNIVLAAATVQILSWSARRQRATESKTQGAAPEAAAPHADGAAAHG